MRNPWIDAGVTFRRDDNRAGTMKGSLLTFATEKNETINLQKNFRPMAR